MRLPSMYIFVFKYLNTSFAAIPRERVRKIFRRLFTEPLLPLREAQDSFFDFLRFHSSLWNSKSWLLLLLLLFFFPLFLLFSRFLPFSDKISSSHDISSSYFLLSRLFLPSDDDKSLDGTKWRGTVFRSNEKERGKGERRVAKKRESEKFASSSDKTRFRQPTVDYFYARTQLFIVQRIIRSIRPLRHSHYENSRVPERSPRFIHSPAYICSNNFASTNANHRRDFFFSFPFLFSFKREIDAYEQIYVQDSWKIATRIYNRSFPLLPLLSSASRIE